jgi:tetratricopeptide (TPR) repeat protein
MDVTAQLARRQALIKNALLALLIIVAIAAIGVSWWAFNSVGTASSTGLSEGQHSSSNPATADEALTVSLNAQLDVAARRSLQQRLTEFQQALDNISITPGMAQYAVEQQRDMQTQLTQAYSLYTQTQYPAATQILDTLSQDLANYRLGYDSALSQQLSAAQTAYQQRDQAQAQLAINQALRLAPENSDVLSLRDKIQALPDIVQAERAIGVARAENQPSKEIRALQQYVAIEPDDTEALTRLYELQQQVRKARIAQLVSDAENAMVNQAFAQAQLFLTQLQQLDPAHPSLPLLKDNIARREAQQGLSVLQQQLKRMAELNDWRGIGFVTQRAITTFPTDPTLQQYQQTALQLQRWQNQLQPYLNAPQRLSDANIQTQAVRLLNTIKNGVGELGVDYQPLEQSLQQLTQYLTEASSLIMLTLYSDGESDVSIRGRGQLGQFRERNVALPQGTHTFEVNRSGYRTKLITVDVSTDTPALTLLSDEPVI